MAARAFRCGGLVQLSRTLAIAAFAVLLSGAASAAPELVRGRNFAGQFDPEHFAHASGAIGPTRYIQLINREYAIYDRRSSTRLIVRGLLDVFADHAAGVSSDFPQIIWDATTSRFYYTMYSRFADRDHRFSYGWSKTASPNSPADFCHFNLGFGADIPASPKLGDSRDLLIIAYDLFRSGGTRHAQITTFQKPAPGPACGPQGPVFGLELTDPAGNALVSPVAANGIDSLNPGYVLARDPTLPSKKLWIFGVIFRSGVPVFGPRKELALPFSYDVPPSAIQPGSEETLDTGDASPSQAVIARNPDRGNAFSLWTQHTVKDGALSAVRWYEIDPSAQPPKLLRNGIIRAPPEHFIFNAAISPDRRVDGTTSAFGDSFVIQFNRSGGSGETAIFPEIRIGSSFNGGRLSFTSANTAQDPYSDATCVLFGIPCFWSRAPACAPDPKPQASGRGVVWCTNVFAGPDSAMGNWRTRIFAVRP